MLSIGTPSFDVLDITADKNSGDVYLIASDFKVYKFALSPGAETFVEIGTLKFPWFSEAPNNTGSGELYNLNGKFQRQNAGGVNALVWVPKETDKAVVAYTLSDMTLMDSDTIKFVRPSCSALTRLSNASLEYMSALANNTDVYIGKQVSGSFFYCGKSKTVLTIESSGVLTSLAKFKSDTYAVLHLIIDVDGKKYLLDDVTKYAEYGTSVMTELIEHFHPISFKDGLELQVVCIGMGVASYSKGITPLP